MKFHVGGAVYGATQEYCTLGKPWAIKLLDYKVAHGDFWWLVANTSHK